MSGPLGDRFARRPLIASGYGMAALGMLIVAAAGAWPGVLAGRVVDRLGKGLRGAPRDALLVDGVDPAQRRSRIRVSPHHGYARRGHRPAARAGRIRTVRPPDRPGALPGCDSRYAQRAAHRLGSGTTAQSCESQACIDTRRDSAAARRYWAVVSFLVLFSIANFPDALLLLRLKQIGFSVVGVIMAYVGYNAVYALASFPVGALADRLAGRWCTRLGWCFSRSAISGWASPPTPQPHGR
ncbi:major Facilitator Superfamily protein [Mycobacterium ulcerans str. Harvey]|uniref:Major Facilitator Superfamily protein n=1 Tax=Mycobacterium ulcerans str. Harvey TaxID=1299332 RepID=A0ABN0QLQ6_MYCUL|nr:major Facilitator Superfamily protein [Mycobacterium ulcerans str. Harvey]